MSSKLGRKGDPRMHKAVAARLARPSLSLYEALCIGGFDYSENDDKSVTDEKKVTLGQRKNQLSRRLRLARKQGAEEKKASTSPANTTVLGNTALDSRNEKNGVSISGKKRTEHRHLTEEQLMRLRNELAAPNFNPSNGRNGEGMGTPLQMGDQQSKRPRFTKCLNSTTFDRTCTMTPAIQYLHQWPMNNLSRMGGHGNPLNGSAQGVHYPTPQFYAPRMPNRIPDQGYASPVALSSLVATAQAVGLTLDQLALTLTSNTNSLSKLIAEVRSGDSELRQEQMALDLYKTEVKGLYTKCLLMAGVDASLAEQNTPTYIKFAMRACEEEGKRLRSLQDSIGLGKGTKNVTIDMSPTILDGNNNNCNNEAAVVTSDSDRLNQIIDNDHSSYDHNHSHNQHNDHNDGNDGSSADMHDRSTCDARHMHRLGECGHRAVIHQPKDGVAHIDFIVNGQVECYGGQESVSVKSVENAWPSKYRCKDLEDCTNKACGRGCGKSVASGNSSDWGIPSMGQEPKIFKLSDIDTGDSEWTFDANEDADDGVMGLFKLGKEASELHSVAKII